MSRKDRARRSVGLSAVGCLLLPQPTEKGENGYSPVAAVHNDAGGIRYLLPRPAEIPQRF